MAQVTFKNLQKRYGQTEVVKSFDLEIEDGEFVVLLGPSGCGKSTTLRMLAGLEEISGGEIYIGDTLVNDLHPIERNIAMVFQSYALYPHMTVRENIAFSLKIGRVDKALIAERVKYASDMLELTPLLDRKPKALSGGQRQRVAMGRAMVRTPEVFLFDEPLSNLDAKLRGQMRGEIKALHQKLGTTTIYVTHDQVEAMTLADRIVILNGGIIEQIGTPKQIFEKPNNRFVASFIGSPEMNQLKAKLTSSQQIELGEQSISTKAHFICSEANCNFGIRPSDLHLQENSVDAPTVHSLEALLNSQELLGSTYHLHCTIGDNRFVAEVATSEHLNTKEGETLRLYFDEDRMHLFDHQDKVIIAQA